jgi:aspartate/methionine/tyrosine aminotransferase
LDHWLAEHDSAAAPIRYDLASSAGPVWTLEELMALAGDMGKPPLGTLPLSYSLPQGSKSLREQIALFCEVQPEWVVTMTGASEALSALFCLAAGPDSSVVLPAPAFPAMAALAQAWGHRVKTYALSRGSRYSQSAIDVLSVVDETTRFVLVNAPHNPTGSVMTERELAYLAASLAEKRIPLVVDQVCHPLYHDAEHLSSATIPNVIVVGDLSKALSLPGLRIGWIIDRDQRRRERLVDLRSYFTISGSPLTEAIGVHALIHRHQILDRLRAAATANLALLQTFMSAHAHDIGWVRPGGGTVAFPWRLDGVDSRPLCNALAQQGVLIVPGDCFDAPEHFRLGFGAQVHGFADALDIFDRTLKTDASLRS